MLTSSAPGKIILFGEHAVVFGKPAIAIAISLRLRCTLAHDMQFTFNDQPLSRKHHPYIVAALEKNWTGGPLKIKVNSDLPSGSGLGSSAAITGALIGGLFAMKGTLKAEEVAKKAFDVELAVQGRASPVDTSTCVHGHGIFINSIPGDDLLWRISSGLKEWFVHHCEVPRMKIVIGFTGISAPTGPLVERVRRFVETNRSGIDIIEEIGQIAIDGIKKLRVNDLVALGELMKRNQELLSMLGVSTPALEKLITASSPHSFGAKLTGAGGGGSIIALTDQPEKVSEAIRKKGGVPYIVETKLPGLLLSVSNNEV
ncbi:MAG: mevalonate kinase [Methanomassiliicoccales archaeon]